MVAARPYDPSALAQTQKKKTPYRLSFEKNHLQQPNTNIKPTKHALRDTHRIPIPPPTPTQPE